jgi:hypothetical protein
MRASRFCMGPQSSGGSSPCPLPTHLLGRLFEPHYIITGYTPPGRGITAAHGFFRELRSACGSTGQAEETGPGSPPTAWRLARVSAFCRQEYSPQCHVCEQQSHSRGEKPPPEHKICEGLGAPAISTIHKHFPRNETWHTVSPRLDSIMGYL